MDPYWTNGAVTVYLGKCEDVMPSLDDNCVDVIVTDPPWGVDYVSNRGAEKRPMEGDMDIGHVRLSLVEACRLLRRGRHAYVFGPPELVPEPLTATAELVWDKTIVGMGNLSLPWGPSHEPITFATYEPSKANREKGYGRLSARLRQGSVLRCQRTIGGSTSRHPTEKPTPILRQMIEASSVLGETVLDPYMGVGSTLVAAILEGRDAIGIEFEERYCATAVKRIEEALKWVPPVGL